MSDGPATATLRAWVREHPSPWTRAERMRLNALMTDAIVETDGAVVGEAMALVQLVQLVTPVLQLRVLVDSAAVPQRRPLIWLSLHRKATDSLEALNAAHADPSFDPYRDQIERSLEMLTSLEREATAELAAIGQKDLTAALAADERSQGPESPRARGTCQGAQAAQAEREHCPRVDVVRLALEDFRRLLPGLGDSELAEPVRTWIADLEATEARLENA